MQASMRQFLLFSDLCSPVTDNFSSLFNCRGTKLHERMCSGLLANEGDMLLIQL